MPRKCLHDSLRLVRIDRVVNYSRRWFHERDRNIPLHQQVGAFGLMSGIVGINEKLFESLNVFLEMIESNCDSGVIFVRHYKAIAFGSIDFANLKTGLHETAGA